ncbi:hypothetical protein [Pseudomonas sp. Sample_10]|uniref:DUF7693 family protein n=1 Tax=Pseudomonas sp. Sample_10 TaxID=2448269 RepID=UPI001035A502|nr:hypothetical protein [Pseudomonas sp. Sample_10]
MKAETIMSKYSAEQIIACRRVAMEQNKKLFEKANAINRSALDLLDRSDFDSEMFLVYLELREKANNLFVDALDHITLLNEHFPSQEQRYIYKSKHSYLEADCDSLDCEDCRAPDGRVESLEAWQRHGTDSIDLLSG